jgi:uncharacterized protein with PQ loop repeat
MHGLVHHHFHSRTHHSAQSTAKPSFWVIFLEKITIVAGVIGPLMVLPQIYKIYSSHDASGVSTLSWFAFGVLDIPFIIYGAVHKDTPIILTYTLWFIANFGVAIGAIIYR